MQDYQWSEELRVDNDVIDSQHRKVFQLITIINEKINNNASFSSYETTLYELLDTLYFHFQSEEKILKNFQYKELEDHMHTHQKLIEIIELNSMKLINSNSTIVKEFLIWLEKSWYHHITCEDMKYKEIITASF